MEDCGSNINRVHLLDKKPTTVFQERIEAAPLVINDVNEIFWHFGIMNGIAFSYEILTNVATLELNLVTISLSEALINKIFHHYEFLSRWFWISPHEVYSLFHGFWQSFVTIGSCNHLMRIISTYVGNLKKSEISWRWQLFKLGDNQLWGV